LSFDKHSSTGCPAPDATQGAGVTFVSFLIGRVTALWVEVQPKMQPNSSESSVESFCDLRREEVVQEQENRLGMRGTGRANSEAKRWKNGKTRRVIGGCQEEKMHSKKTIVGQTRNAPPRLGGVTSDI